MTLRGRLGLTHAAVAVLAILIVAVVIVVAGGRRFDRYALAAQSQRTRTVVDAVASGYDGSGWSGAATAIDQLATANSVRIWVYDSAGRLVFASGHMGGMGGMGSGPGMMIGPTPGGTPVGGSSGGGGLGPQVDRYPLVYQGRTVGTIVVAQSRAGGLAINAAFRHDLVLYLVAAGAIAALVAVVIGVAATRRITSPLEQLTVAASAMGRGERQQRVTPQPSKHDEVAALTTAFNSMAQAIEDQETWRRNLSADLAHELRTPLATIQARVEALQDGLLPCSAENLAVVADESARLGRLLGALRALDDLDAVDFSLEMWPLRLDEVAGEAVAAGRERFAQSSVKLVLDADSIEVSGDRDRLRQVVDNLLDNALRFTPPAGSVTVTVAAHADRGRLTVRDTGPGIAPSDLPRVFERFFRAPAQNQPGAGLGLAIAKRLIEAHGGTILAESEPGHGASFTIDLPLAMPSDRD